MFCIHSGIRLNVPVHLKFVNIINIESLLSKDSMEYSEAIKYLYNLKIFGMSLGLERIEYLLKTLGSPHKGMRIVHVAGTNGKGSVAAMLTSVLQAAGYKVGLFTSPHLTDFEERIVVNQKKISRDRLSALVDRIKPIAEEMVHGDTFEHPTFFEIATAMALKHFYEEKVDFAVLEVGLGGRLDATNVVTPEVSVITTIALDHTHVLGTTLEAVAREKAGIIKPGVPVVTGIEDEDLLEMFKNISHEKNSLLHSTKEILSYTKKESNLEGQTFDIIGLGRGYENLTINLLGEHQIANACIAALVVDVMRKKGIAVSDTALKKGFKDVKWPARFQVVQREPAILLDCAHNPAGMRTLKRTLEDYFSKQRVTLVLGIMRDKDIPGILKEIAPLAHNIIITKPKFERAAEPSVIEAEARKYSDNIVVINSVSEALSHAQRNATKYDVICVCGSIFNVGEAMEVLGEKTG